jgi:hypothetical protein
MGTSTDAILVYGIPIEDEELARAYYNADEDEDEDFEGSEAERLAYHGGDINGVILVDHCSHSCNMHIVGIKGTETQAWRGYPKQIPVADLTPSNPEWDEKLSAFIDRNKLTAAGQPGWYLASWWG